MIKQARFRLTLLKDILWTLFILAYKTATTRLQPGFLPLVVHPGPERVPSFQYSAEVDPEWMIFITGYTVQQSNIFSACFASGVNSLSSFLLVSRSTAIPRVLQACWRLNQFTQILYRFTQILYTSLKSLCSGRSCPWFYFMGKGHCQPDKH